MKKWPWVSRESSDTRASLLREQIGMLQGQLHIQDAQVRYWHQQYTDLVSKYHDLRLKGANPVEPEKPVPAPQMPHPAILRAMRAISPRDDNAFAANMRLWAEHRDEAEKDPEAFADRIRKGRLTTEPAPARAD